MKPYTNPLPKPPPPSAQRPFDPWNSSSTGHQRREASRRETDGVSETSWRASRAAKLNRQFQTQSHLPAPPPDTKPAAPQQQQQTVAEMLAKPGSMKVQAEQAEKKEEEEKGERRLFAGLVVYVNGSTAPLVSDHHLKTALAARGARVALHLARRHVTHVVLGRPAGVGTGCGGGLAGTKMEREIRRRGGSGIKYVGVEWVLESIRAGKRLPEARFANLALAPYGQSSVYGLSKKPAA